MPDERPCAGLRVLDLSRVLAGPLCTMRLAELGADVWKIERPPRPGAGPGAAPGGDETRAWGPPFVAGESAYFLAVNRGKKSVALDLARPAGRELALALAARADVVVENFAPGRLAALGIDLAALRARDPRLVTCSITGFGSEGPGAARPGDGAGRPGYDALVQATGGLMSLTGEPGGPPCKVGVAIADVLAGDAALAGILAALLVRARTGRGQHVEIALEDALVAALVNQAQACLVTGEAPGRLGSAHPQIVPYQTFATADGHLVVAVGNDAQFARLAAALGLPELAADARFATNADRVRHRAVLVPRLAARLRERPSAHWAALLADARVPAGEIRALDAVLADPALRRRGLRGRVEHPSIGPLEVVGSPIGLRGTPPELGSAPPRLGEHTAEVLGEVLGLDAGRLAALRAAGAIA